MIPVGRRSVAGSSPRFEKEVDRTEMRKVRLTTALTIPRAEALLGTSRLRVPVATIELIVRS